VTHSPDLEVLARLVLGDRYGELADPTDTPASDHTGDDTA